MVPALGVKLVKHTETLRLGLAARNASDWWRLAAVYKLIPQHFRWFELDLLLSLVLKDPIYKAMSHNQQKLS